MKRLLLTRRELYNSGRWDIDFHLPPEGIKKFPKELLSRVDAAADIGKDKRDPLKNPEVAFQYIDISCIDVSVGVIATPQELMGEEAPSRARKVVQAFDIVVSTCRPTRGAIAVVPPHLHNQIASTGFSIIRPKAGVNPFFLHYALRLVSTLEQFRKWSTGSSYPAILDEDVAKTLIPLPDAVVQDEIASKIMLAMNLRNRAIQGANRDWVQVLDNITHTLTGSSIALGASVPESPIDDLFEVHTIKDIANYLAELPSII